MKLTEKAKRYLLVLGGILLCAGLLVAIWFQLKPEAVPEERFEAETGEVTEITVDMEQEEEKGQGAQNGDGIVETASMVQACGGTFSGRIKQTASDQYGGGRGNLVQRQEQEGTTL